MIGYKGGYDASSCLEELSELLLYTVSRIVKNVHLYSGDIVLEIFESSRRIANPEKSKYLYINQSIIKHTSKLAVRIKSHYHGQRSI